jgi:two-component system nitrogen regulation sensor histidine kinase GlnL
MDILSEKRPFGMPTDVLNALPHPVFMVSADGGFEFVNAAAEAFFQSSFTVLKNRKFSWFLPDGSPMRTLVEQVQNTRSPISEYKVDVSSPRLGGERFVDVYVSPVVEHPESIVVLLQVRSMADTLDKQLTHRGAARTVTGLASMLAHEIKNPLSGIRGAAQLLEAHSDEDDRALTRLIMDETDRIVRLVDRMEVFSDERPIERDPVNVHSVLEHVKRLARSGFAQNMTIIEHYDPSLPPVLGNRDQLIQVFLNLIKNACEAMPDEKGAKLTLTTAYRPGMSVAAPGSRERISLPISMTVSDNGPGVPDDILSYMFDPFVSSKPNGSGLGLALVAKIIGDHGGVISCDSQPTGTNFQVLMPMWSEERSS